MAAVLGLEDVGRDDVALAGGKGANLGELVRAGFPMPPGFVVTTVAYRVFVAANTLAATLADPDAIPSAARERVGVGLVPDEVREEILAAYAALGRPPVAVRSSATAEDLAGASFAGQQDTYLNVRGDEALVDAVRRCWGSLWSDRAVAYRANQGLDPAGVAMAVVVEEMVEADAAGVLFTANPALGRRQETVISAAWGLGEAVVGGLVDTDQVVVRNPKGPVLSRTTADKAVMTAYTPDCTAERDVPAPDRNAPVLDDDAAVELTRLGAAVEAHFGAPQDIEWTRRDGTFFLVQSRPITVLPPPEADPPTDWSVPDRDALYVRASIVEQLPDPLTPLFADLIDPAVTRSLTDLMTELVGPGSVHPGDVALPTVNGYAYYRYSRPGMLRITLRTSKALPVLGRGRQSGRERWRSYAHPRYRRLVAAWAVRDPLTLDPAELVDGVEALLYAGAEYYTSVQTLIPVAAMSEVLFTTCYDRLARRAGDPAAATFLLGFDSAPLRAEESLSALAGWARQQPALAAALVDTSTPALLADREADELQWPDFWARLGEHLDRYGHLVYNLDFANPVPADSPGPLLDTLRFYLSAPAADTATDPALRQLRSAVARGAATTELVSRLGPLRGALLTRLLRRAQDAAPVREDALADVGLAWPVLRRLLAETGRRLVEADVLGAADDVF